MKNKLRFLIAFVISVLITAALASMFSTQFVVASHRELGIDIPMSTRLIMTFGDLASIKLLGLVIGATFIIAFGVAKLARHIVGGHRLSWYVVAGGVGYLSAILLLEYQLQLMPIAGARTSAGLATQALSGAIGGMIFAKLTSSRDQHRYRSQKEGAQKDDF